MGHLLIILLINFSLSRADAAEFKSLTQYVRSQLLRKVFEEQRPEITVLCERQSYGHLQISFDIAAQTLQLMQKNTPGKAHVTHYRMAAPDPVRFKPPFSWLIPDYNCTRFMGSEGKVVTFKIYLNQKLLITEVEEIAGSELFYDILENLSN